MNIKARFLFIITLITFTSVLLYRIQKNPNNNRPNIHPDDIYDPTMSNPNQEFMDAFPVLLEELIDHLKSLKMPDNAIAYFERLTRYNVLGGKMNRGLTVADTLRVLKGDQVLTKDEIFKANILGWGIEWLQACFLVADDIMDDSPTRRGQPCWYRVEDVGLVAINDSFLLKSAIFFMLKKHFRTEPYYVDLVEIFTETSYMTELGQLMDLITAPENQVDLSKFTMEKHSFIVTYKTAFYSFYLPVALAMHMTGIKDESAFKQAEKILLPLGQYFQIQDDYLDCYGDPATIGKIGTDIEDNKCCWLINKALTKVTPAQREILDNNYGKKDPANVKAVKDVYKELDIEGEYKAYEDDSYIRLNALIEEIDHPQLKKQVFHNFMKRIYKRQK